MIEQLSAKNFGCLKDVTTPKLGMLHAFIGPNDSGKSTLLRAIRVAAQLASEGALRAPSTGAPVVAGLDVELTAKTPGGEARLVVRDSELDFVTFNGQPSAGHNGQQVSSAETAIRRELRSTRLLRLDPDALRTRSSLIPDGGTVGFLNDRGNGLPGVYDHIVNRGDDAFGTIRRHVLELFPAVAGLRLRAVTPGEKEIEVELWDGVRVPASPMSEGLLYFLAFAALPYLPIAHRKIVLVWRNPKTVLHPARIAEVDVCPPPALRSGTAGPPRDAQPPRHQRAHRRTRSPS